jgi:hypothetical protein
MSTANGKSMLTITEAAEVAGVDRRIIQRRLDAGEFPSAHKEGKGRGRWLIPSAELDAAGLTGPAPTGAQATAAPHASDQPDAPAGGQASVVPKASIRPHTSVEHIEPMVVPVLSEVEVLRAEMTTLRIRAEVAEAEARERERVIAAKDDDLNSLRAILMSGPMTQLAGPAAVAPVAAAVAPVAASEAPAPAAEPPVGASEPPVATPRTALTSLWAPDGPVQPEPEPPRRRWWQSEVPPPATLDSFWLTDEPVEFEAPPRPWWRVRWPWSRNRSGQST